MKKLIALLAAVAAALTMTACTSNNANKRDAQVSRAILGQYEISQPVPQFKWSQIRQTAIDIETAQARSTQTTTFFFNLGVTDPVMSCPSIGFPVASTTQITNPQQSVGGPESGNVPISQIDPNGIYSGDSSGTYVLCVDGKGQTYGDYWEGYVYTTTGPAVWDVKAHTVKRTGPSSFQFQTK